MKHRQEMIKFVKFVSSVFDRSNVDVENRLQSSNKSIYFWLFDSEIVFDKIIFKDDNEV
jgi:hypothetical protein